MSKESCATYERFAKWFIENYPGPSTIVDPKWHVERIFHAAQASPSEIEARRYIGDDFLAQIMDSRYSSEWVGIALRWQLNAAPHEDSSQGSGTPTLAPSHAVAAPGSLDMRDRFGMCAAPEASAVSATPPTTPPEGYTLVETKSFDAIMRILTKEQMRELCRVEGERIFSGCEKQDYRL